jgi:hypothetical protein
MKAVRHTGRRAAAVQTRLRDTERGLSSTLHTTMRGRRPAHGRRYSVAAPGVSRAAPPTPGRTQSVRLPGGVARPRGRRPLPLGGCAPPAFPSCPSRGQVGGDPTGEEARGRMPSMRFPPPTSPRWGEARVLTTPPWTTTRDILFKKSPKQCLPPTRADLTYTDQLLQGAQLSGRIEPTAGVGPGNFA